MRAPSSRTFSPDKKLFLASAPIASVVDAEELEDNTIALVIDAEFPDPNANQTITISGMPEGATLSVGTDNHDGSWTLAPEQLEKLTITPPADSNQNFTLMVTATATETSTGATAETAATINVSVTGFTDPPTVGTALGDPLSSFANTVDRIGPVGHWRFEESSGTDADNDVIYHNGVTLGAEGIDGDGSAASFDGYNNFVEIPYFDDLPLDRGSVQLWFNTPDVNSRQGLFSKNSNDDGTLAIWIENGEINVRLRSDDSSHNIRSNFDLSVEEWRQVTLNFGPDEMELYVDGTLAGTSDHAGGLGTPSGGSGNSKSVIIGAIAEATGDGVANNLKNFFQGRIDEVVIYDRPLSAGQVASLYNVGTRGGDILIFPLDVTASLTDADDSNTLSVTVSGLPKGATLSAGTDNGDGLWALTPAQLNGLMVSIGPDVTDDLNLSATARATENDGDFAETVTVSVRSGRGISAGVSIRPGGF